MDKIRKGFHVSNRAWYKDVVKGDRMMIGLYHDEGGTSGEFSVRWQDLGLAQDTPKVQLYSDSWKLFVEFGDFFKALADRQGQDVTQDEMIALLLSLGFEDMTEYKNPRG